MCRWWILVGFLTYSLGSLPWTSPVYADSVPVDPSLLAGLRMRSIGPAGMSGRVTAIEAEVGDGNRIFVGTASSGVWRSVNGGQSFEPVFDDMPVHSIGAIAIDPSNASVVWVGTGEGNPRNSVSLGNGIYRSLDGGETWTHMGLGQSERIHRIVVDPRRSEVVYACVPGRAWGEGGERGVWKTEDGGRNWHQALEVNDSTGCGDLVMDPQNPEKLFAGMWQFRRQPWFFTSGGPGSGLYSTHDGGETWRRLTSADGLPEGELGRIGLAIAPSDPRVVYALVEAEKNALLRSMDGGRSFATVNDAPQLAPRPFYFCDLRVDPQWPDRIYLLDYELRVSDDGGATVSVLPGGGEHDLHVDHHALWIDPQDPEYLLNGNDGGVAISRDRGRTFRVVNNLPLGQLYHVAVDDEVPYNVYGGLQDNGSWRGPSAVFDEGGIRNHHWQPVGDGDGFDVRPDPDDSRRGYAMWQGGQLTRWDLDAGTWRPIVPPPPADGTSLRFNWDAAFALDPFDPATVYYGSQFLHRSRDRGDTWEILSPDLTSNNPERQRQAESGGITSDVTHAENFTTLVAIAPSPLARGQIWTGSDDGRLHLTRDGGTTWTRLDSKLPAAAPDGAWVPYIEASPHDAATAFVVLDDHRRSNFRPYVARTDDYGVTWRLLSLNGVRGYALVLVQDPVRAELLYLGTEFGLWISLDGGATWLPFRHGLPTTSVMDLVVHARDHDLGWAPTAARSSFSTMYVR